jgi:hypothetical protein
MSDVNVVRKRAGTVLSYDGIDKYSLSFLCVLWPQFGNLIVTLCRVIKFVSHVVEAPLYLLAFSL